MWYVPWSFISSFPITTPGPTASSGVAAVATVHQGHGREGMALCLGAGLNLGKHCLFIGLATSFM